MDYYIAIDRFGNYDLAHHGIKGMRWGIRRYQNPDGSLTPEGEARYYDKNGRLTKHGVKAGKRLQRKEIRKIQRNEYSKASEKTEKEYRKASDYAEEHGLDYDDYVDKYSRIDFSKEARANGIDSRKISAIIKYSELTDIAAAKEIEYFNEAERIANDIIREERNRPLSYYLKRSR